MSDYRLMFSTLMIGFVAAMAVAQAPVRGGGPRRPREEPCWQVAGIPKSAMQQEQTVRLQARQEVEAVCANSSLTPKQKHEQIHDIREKERQQAEALINPQQREALRTCRLQRGEGGGHHGNVHGGGPCEELSEHNKKSEHEPED